MPSAASIACVHGIQQGWIWRAALRHVNVSSVTRILPKIEHTQLGPGEPDDGIGGGIRQWVSRWRIEQERTST